MKELGREEKEEREKEEMKEREKEERKERESERGDREKGGDKLKKRNSDIKQVKLDNIKTIYTCTKT